MSLIVLVLGVELSVPARSSYEGPRHTGRYTEDFVQLDFILLFLPSVTSKIFCTV